MSTTLNTFHLFPNLPTEIRLKIWTLELSTPRTIVIRCVREAIKIGTTRVAKSWSADTPCPPLLLVNRESRFEALNIYAPYFTTTLSTRPIYLALLQDTVYFPDGVLPYVPPSPLHEIQKMVVQTDDSAYFGFYNMEILKGMKSLRELKLYAGKVNGPWYEHEDIYLDMLMRDFRDAIEASPEWDCPTVRIFSGETGEEKRFVPGGAKSLELDSTSES